MKNKIQGVSNLKLNEDTLKKLELRKLSLEGSLTGYASVDKPWLKHYSEEHIMAEIPHMTVYEYLKKMNENNLDGVAFNTLEGKYTYQEFFDIIDSVAQSLYTLGITKGKKILMMLPPTVYESFLFYGTDKAGGAISEVPIETTADEIVTKINKLDMDVFFVNDKLLTSQLEEEIYNKTSVKNIVVIGSCNFNTNEKTLSWDEFLDIGKDIKIPDVNKNPEDLLFIASTGGSTGEPKNVMLNDNCFNVAVHQFINSDLNYSRGDRWLRLWSLFSATAMVSNNHLPLCVGMHNIIRDFPRNILDFDKIVVEAKSNHYMLIPQLLDVLKQSELIKQEGLGDVKTVGCGGLAITEQFENSVDEFLESHGVKAFLGYGWGCTENSSLGAMRSNYDTTVVGTSGAPQVNCTVSAFVPGTDEELKYREEGELCINSDMLMMGYYGDPETSSLVLKQHKDGKTWLHTGDLGFVDENGLVTVKGRMTRTIFVFPTAKIYPTRLENVIAKIPGIQDVVVGEIPDPLHDGFGLPVCFVIPNKEANLDLLSTTIENVCETYFADYARPHDIFFLEEFPLTKVGKKDVLALENSIKENKDLSKIKKP